MKLIIELQDGWTPGECDFCIDPYTSGPKEPCSKDCPLVVAWEKLKAEEKSKPAPICVRIDEPHPLPELGIIKPAAVMCHDCRTCALREGFPCNKPIKPAPVEAKATADGSLWKEIRQEAFRWDKNKYGDVANMVAKRFIEITDRYRPASPAVEELVRELRGMLKEYHPDSEEYCSETKHLAYDIETILAKYDNAKGR